MKTNNKEKENLTSLIFIAYSPSPVVRVYVKLKARLQKILF